jgi:hypothetical protein
MGINKNEKKLGKTKKKQEMFSIAVKYESQ